jgi:hypothetical protein
MKLMNMGSPALSNLNLIQRRQMGRFFNDDSKRVEKETDVSCSEVDFKEGLNKSTKDFNVAGFGPRLEYGRNLL